MSRAFTTANARGLSSRPESPSNETLRDCPRFRGLHLSTFRLNVSAFCGIGVAVRGYRISRGCS